MERNLSYSYEDMDQGHAKGSSTLHENLPVHHATRPRTIFIGDLSYFVTEQHLFDHFQHFGVIESVQLKSSKEGKPHLSYGFIKYESPDAAAAAIQQMDGNILLGRAIRVGWASDNPNKKLPRYQKKAEKSKNKPTAQVHVNFTALDVKHPVTEATLREIYGQFGELIDVTIRKTTFDKHRNLQTGYGFIHYELTNVGISSAYAAVQNTHQVTIGPVRYECSFSHGLQDYLASISENETMKAEFFPKSISAPEVGTYSGHNPSAGFPSVTPPSSSRHSPLPNFSMAADYRHHYSSNSQIPSAYTSYSGGYSYPSVLSSSTTQTPQQSYPFKNDSNQQYRPSK